MASVKAITDRLEQIKQRAAQYAADANAGTRNAAADELLTAANLAEEAVALARELADKLATSKKGG